MISKIYSITVNWLNSDIIEIEVDINNWMPAFKIVGLPDQSVQESKERIRSALKNSWKKLPTTRIIVNLAPADIKKTWPSFDFPIAIGILLNSWEIEEKFIRNFMLSLLFALIIMVGLSISYLFLLKAFNIIDWSILKLIAAGMALAVFPTAFGVIFLNEDDKKKGNVFIPVISYALMIFLFLGIVLPITIWFVVKAGGWLIKFVKAVFSFIFGFISSIWEFIKGLIG